MGFVKTSIPKLKMCIELKYENGEQTLLTLNFNVIWGGVSCRKEASAQVSGGGRGWVIFFSTLTSARKQTRPFVLGRSFTSHPASVDGRPSPRQRRERGGLAGHKAETEGRGLAKGRRPCARAASKASIRGGKVSHLNRQTRVDLREKPKCEERWLKCGG